MFLLGCKLSVLLLLTQMSVLLLGMLLRRPHSPTRRRRWPFGIEDNDFVSVKPAVVVEKSHRKGKCLTRMWFSDLDCEVIRLRATLYLFVEKWHRKGKSLIRRYFLWPRLWDHPVKDEVSCDYWHFFLKREMFNSEMMSLTHTERSPSRKRGLLWLLILKQGKYKDYSFRRLIVSVPTGRAPPPPPSTHPS